MGNRVWDRSAWQNQLGQGSLDLILLNSTTTAILSVQSSEQELRDSRGTRSHTLGVTKYL